MKSNDMEKGLSDIDILLKQDYYTRKATLALLIGGAISCFWSILLPQMIKTKYFTIPGIWTAGLLAFVALMASTFAVKTYFDATMIIGLCGFVWAVINCNPKKKREEFFRSQKFGFSFLFLYKSCLQQSI